MYLTPNISDSSLCLYISYLRPAKQPPMSAARTYSPLPPMIPAGDIFRADPCGPREPDPRPHTYGVRMCPCAAFATEPCRPTACVKYATNLPSPSTDHCSLLGYRYVSPNGDGFPVTYSVTLSHTDHSSLITVHSSHTFSAKEKDSETGLSYFGSRYYSSDLSIWLSVNPMSDKYPSLSPYVYCADNPVKLVDPNGEDPIYAKNFWGNVKKIGDDGQCGLNSFLVLGDKAKEVKAATKKGVFYTGGLSSSDLVIHIPTGQIQQDVQYTVEQSLRSGDSPENRVEYGGHSLIYGIFIRIAPWFHLVILKKWMVGAPMALKEVLLSSVQMTGKCHFTMNQKL